MTPLEFVGLIAIDILGGIVGYRLGGWIINKYKQRMFWKRTQESEEAGRKRRSIKINEQLDWHNWLLTGGITRDQMFYYFNRVLSPEDKENLAFLHNIAYDVLNKNKYDVEFGKIDRVIYAIDADERRYESTEEVFEVTISIGVLPSVEPDVDRRRELGEMIVTELHDYIRETYGEYGRSNLNLHFRAAVEEDEV